MHKPALKTFIIYARDDKPHKDVLLRHLKPLQRNKKLEIWHDGDILPGEDWQKEIKTNLHNSDLVLVLVSVNCLNSDFIQTDELVIAWEKFLQGSTRIVPIIVSPCLWEEEYMFRTLHGLPQNMKAISTWQEKDEAWDNVGRSISAMVEQIWEKRAEEERKKKEEVERKERERLEKIAAERKEQEYLERKAHQEKWLQKLEMVFVEGGTFQMGSNDESYTKPRHTVSVRNFYMGKYPLTQKLYTEIMGTNPSYFKGNENLPVEWVSWEDAKAFIVKLNQLSGLSFALPSEAQWEYAARGGKYSKGYTYAGSNNIDEVAWYNGNSEDKTHPVGQKKANELGLYDMTGNISEWCEDDWHEDYTNAPANDTAWLDAPNRGAARVFRGGFWKSDQQSSRVSFRYSSSSPTNRYRYLGFRLSLLQSV